MTEELKFIQDTLFHIAKLSVADITEDEECKEYDGYNFHLGALKIKYRKAKVTPKKTGQFVTLWKRNAKKQTEPFHIDDGFDWYMIITPDNDKLGFFFFPKHVLAQNQILSVDGNVGKRGFRLYPDWDYPSNRQAIRTKEWQTKYFIDLSTDVSTLPTKAQHLLSILDQSGHNSHNT